MGVLLLASVREPTSLRPVISMRFPEVKWVDTGTLAEWMTRPLPQDPVLLDVRREDEFEVSHLQGARRVDPDAPDIESLHITPGRRVVVYCSVGYRSGAIVEKLYAAGLGDVYNLEGGIFAWANEGRPVFRDGEPAETVHPYDGFWASFLRRDLRAPEPEPAHSPH